MMQDKFRSRCYLILDLLEMADMDVQIKLSKQMEEEKLRVIVK